MAKDMIFRLRLAFLPAIVFLLFFTTAQAQPGQPTLSENTLKSALLFKLPRFIYWPENIKDTFNLCVIGKNNFSNLLRKLAQAPLNNRKVILHEIEELDAESVCNMAFISNSKEDNLTDILNQLSKKPVVTVSDINEFSSQGGMIELSSSDSNKISIIINQTAAHKQSIRFNAQLLRLAKLVK